MYQNKIQHILGLWQYGLWSFQMGYTKLKRFLHKNQHSQRKLLNFEFWINGELSKVVDFIKNVNNKKCASKLEFFHKKRERF